MISKTYSKQLKMQMQDFYFGAKLNMLQQLHLFLVSIRNISYKMVTDTCYLI